METLAQFGTGEVLWSFVWFTLFFIWIWLLIVVFSDIFRSHDMGGFAKALWIIFVIVAPYVGVLIYLIARGKGMAERNIKAAQQQQEAEAAYIKSVAGASTTSPAEEIARLTQLRDSGSITEDEFQQLKAKALA